MKRVLLLVLLPEIAGTQNFALRLVKSFKQDPGYQFTIAAAGKGDLTDRCKELGIEYKALKYLVRPLSLLDFMALIEMVLYFRKEQFDIIHTNGSKTGVLGRLAARIIGTKLIIHTSHGFPFNDYQNYITRVLYKATDRIGNTLSHYTVYVSKGILDYALENKLVNKKRALLVLNGVDYDMNIVKEDVKRGQ